MKKQLAFGGILDVVNRFLNRRRNIVSVPSIYPMPIKSGVLPENPMSVTKGWINMRHISHGIYHPQHREDVDSYRCSNDNMANEINKRRYKIRR